MNNAVERPAGQHSEGPLQVAVVGEGLHAVQRARAIAASGRSVTFYSLTDPDTDCGGLTVYASPHGNTSIRAGLRFISNLVKGAPDVWYVHYAGGFLGWATLLFAQAPIAVNVMGGDVLFEEQQQHATPWGKALAKWLLRSAILVTVKSHQLADVVRDFGVAQDRILVTYWGIERPRAARRSSSQLRDQLGLPEGGPVIFSPRSMQPIYNIELIVRAFGLLSRRLPAAHLIVPVVNADQRYYKRVIRCVDELGLAQRVHFVEPIPDQEIWDYYELADVVVSAAASDGMPQSLLEALLCGTPAVLGALESYRELVTHGESVWLGALTPQGMAEGIETVIKDPSLRARMSRTGMQLVEKVGNLEVETRRVCARLEHALSEHSQSLLLGRHRFVIFLLFALESVWRFARRVTGRR